MDFVHKYIYLCKWEYAEIPHVARKIDLTNDSQTEREQKK